MCLKYAEFFLVDLTVYMISVFSTYNFWASEKCLAPIILWAFVTSFESQMLSDEIVR